MTNKISNIPIEPHFAIITTKTFYENNGYSTCGSYPDNTSTTVPTYQVYKDEAEWKADIERLTRNNVLFRAIKAFPATVSVNVEVNVPTLSTLNFPPGVR